MFWRSWLETRLVAVVVVPRPRSQVTGHLEEASRRLHNGETDSFFHTGDHVRIDLLVPYGGRIVCRAIEPPLLADDMPQRIVLATSPGFVDSPLRSWVMPESVSRLNQLSRPWRSMFPGDASADFFILRDHVGESLPLPREIQERRSRMSASSSNSRRARCRCPRSSLSGRRSLR